MPDGTIVSPQITPGRNMSERIDNWHKNHPSPVVRAQANIFEVAVAPQAAQDVSVTSYTSYPASHDEEELA